LSSRVSQRHAQLGAVAAKYVLIVAITLVLGSRWNKIQKRTEEN